MKPPLRFMSKRRRQNRSCNCSLR